MPQDTHRRVGDPGRPLAVARVAVEAAVRPLPGLDDRLRHRAEFTADLTALRPSVRCRVLRRHRWVVRRTDDGGRYQSCRDCRRERAEWPRGGAEFGVL